MAGIIAASDPANNVYYVENCAFVRFRMTVFQAIAWSQACVFRFPGPPPPKKGSAHTDSDLDLDDLDALLSTSPPPRRR